MDLANNGTNGIWAPSCIHHVYLNHYKWNSADWTVPTGSAFTTALCVGEWLAGKNSVHIDNVPWPENYGCSTQLKLY